MSEYNIHSNLNSNGDVVANSFTGSGTNLNISSTNNISTTSNISGGVLFGDGTQLQNVSSVGGITHYSEIIGNGSDTEIIVTHSLDTISVTVSVIDRLTSTKVFPSVKLFDNNHVELEFSSPPNIDQYYVSIISVGNSLPVSFSSLSKGYTSGGRTASNARYADIESFDFSSSLNAANIGNLTIAVSHSTGVSSSTDGFTIGGNYGNTYRDFLEKFDFSSSTTSVEHGDVGASLQYPASSSYTTKGFIMGGLSSGGVVNNIRSFEYSSNTTASDLADLSQVTFAGGGCSSSTQGYSCAGGSPPISNIYKFDFVSTTNSVSHGDLTYSGNGVRAFQSNTHGFTAGGFNSGALNIMNKFEFVSNVTASDHGDFLANRLNGQPCSSATQGFYAMGNLAGSVETKTIDRFDFSSNVVATDHGDLIRALYLGAGHQG